jgi:N utilization substance protein B
MATARDIRRLAFQALFQLDARCAAPGAGAVGEQDRSAVRASLDEAEGFEACDRDKAFELAAAAFEGRGAADAVMQELAPTWPAHRQAAVDRAILRLAHYEMTSGRTPPKVAVNEAVELSKVFSTDKSPAFVNALARQSVEADGAAAERQSAGPPPPRNHGPLPSSRQGAGLSRPDICDGCP